MGVIIAQSIAIGSTVGLDSHLIHVAAAQIDHIILSVTQSDRHRTSITKECLNLT